jgi:hypothetical protein
MMHDDIFTILDLVIETHPFRIYPDKGLLVIREKAEGAGGNSVALKTSPYGTKHTNFYQPGV